jgi:hypothetical protein
MRPPGSPDDRAPPAEASAFLNGTTVGRSEFRATHHEAPACHSTNAVSAQKERARRRAGIEQQE